MAMSDIERVEFISEDLRACRACLATNTDLYSIPDGLENKFVQLMGVEFCEEDGLPQHLCSCCRMLLLKFYEFRLRCNRSQVLLKQVLIQQPYISTNDVQSIDRKFHRLSLNLVQIGVYTFDSNTKKEKYNIIEEIENDTIQEVYFDDRDDFNDTNEPQHESFDVPIIDEVDATHDEAEQKGLFVEIDGLNGTIIVNAIDHSADAEKRRIAAHKKQEQAKKRAERKKKNNESRQRITKLVRYVTGKKKPDKPLTKWQLHQRRAENDFMPNFNHAEFESQNDCKIEILSVEEQLQEIEERKKSLNYLNLDYKCEHCGKGFEFEQPYKNHMLKHDPKVGKYVCNICHTRYRIRSLMLRHIDAHKMKFVCNICSFVSRAKHMARNHYLMHMGKVYQCKQCDATFTKNSSYLGHVRIVHPSTEWSCETCGDSFVGRRGLLFHKAKAHMELSTLKLKCKVCGVQFDSAEAKTKHRRGRPKCDTSLRACGECGEMFADETALKDHKADKHVPVMYWCEECSQSFVSQESIDIHYQRIHLKMKWPAYGRNREQNKEYYKKIVQRRRLLTQVVCEMCGLKVKSSSALERHQQSQCKSEKNSKSYQCPFCEKACATRQGLQIHINVHTGDKPYKCGECPLAFRQPAPLKRHHAKVHLGIDTRVSCEICDKSFSTTATLKLHVNTVHLRLPQPPRKRKIES